ncbi:hypothetical protein M0813_15541 [Anaeramoeba flamelloides]|uniref:Ricin B lectin domain-containing protein n=1 Tax=Anaeramoeba flamelloides TaxID=1746091 RepID=A0ABQ8Z1G0_9EUKA|nr:hypothetical protein M0813_15541 [Anaeramoeba flamelloides]
MKNIYLGKVRLEHVSDSTILTVNKGMVNIFSDFEGDPFGIAGRSTFLLWKTPKNTYMFQAETKQGGYMFATKNQPQLGGLNEKAEKKGSQHWWIIGDLQETFYIRNVDTLSFLYQPSENAKGYPTVVMKKMAGERQDFAWRFVDWEDCQLEKYKYELVKITSTPLDPVVSSRNSFDLFDTKYSRIESNTKTSVRSVSKEAFTTKSVQVQKNTMTNNTGVNLSMGLPVSLSTASVGVSKSFAKTIYNEESKTEDESNTKEESITEENIRKVTYEQGYVYLESKKFINCLYRTEIKLTFQMQNKKGKKHNRYIFEKMVKILDTDILAVKIPESITDEQFYTWKEKQEKILKKSFLESTHKTDNLMEKYIDNKNEKSKWRLFKKN